jgi:hypothetical protein
MTPGSEMEESSFEHVIPGTDFVAAMLYARLFEIDPELSLRFKGNLLEQIKAVVRCEIRIEPNQDDSRQTANHLSNCAV